MRTCPPLTRLLILTALFAVLAVAPALAGTSPATPLAVTPAPQAAPAPAADFLATLSADIQGAPGAVFLSGCTSNSQCPKGQLCCLACGFDGCETRACFQPVNGHCPLFV
jgi:hypothetical protein